MLVRGLFPYLVTFSTLIDGYFKQRKLNHALAIYDHMVKVGKGPDLVAYNSIIDALWKEAFVDVTLLVMEEMRRLGLVDVVIYNTLSYLQYFD